MAVHERAWLRMYRSDAKVSQNGRCKYCCAPLKAKQATGDHVKAVIWGGEVTRENIVAACASCNLLKGSMGPKAFLHMIKNPKKGDGYHVWDAWSRRRIWSKVHRACDRICRAVA